MITEPTSSRAVAAVVTGVATAVYYATPDLISSRTARGWAKAGLTAVAVAASVPELRATWATARERQGLDGEAPPSEVFRSLPARSKAVVFGSGAAVLAGSIGGVLVAERWGLPPRTGGVSLRQATAAHWPGPAVRALASGLWLSRLLPAPSDTH
jgi:hypothetical protein